MTHRIRTIIAASLFSAFMLLASSLSMPAYAMTGVTPYFNNPRGTTEQKRALLSQLIEEIKKTNSGDTIRIATYSFSDPVTKDRLIEASQRGVNIQIVLNHYNESVTTQVKQLRTELGTDTTKKSWLLLCERACRGDSESRGMHAKLYMFTIGTTRKVYVGSANLSTHGFEGQWNELVKVNDPDVFAEFLAIFNEMRDDRDVPVRPAVFAGPFKIWAFPRAINQTNDPILRDMQEIGCNGATGTAGQNGSSIVYVSQFSMNGDRGIYLAEKLKDLHNRGCKVFIVKSDSYGPIVDDRLAGIPQLNPAPDLPYTHEKWMVLSGKFGSDSERFMVWTGSTNWGDEFNQVDDIGLRINGDKALFDAYADRIDQLKQLYR